MNLIISGRQTGKTKKLIEACSNDRYSLIVCPTRAMCECTFHMAKEMGMYIPMPITFGEFANRQFCGKHIENFYFDELQMSLEMIAGGVNIKDITLDEDRVKIAHV